MDVIKSKKRKKLGNVAFFGGSFDPIHKGHIAILKKLIRDPNIDFVFVSPTLVSPFKSGHLFDAHTRYRWIKRCLKSPKISILKYEIYKKHQLFTIHTLNFLKKRYKIKNLYLAIGSDNLENLHLWHRYDEILKLATPIVFTRGKKIQTHFQVVDIDFEISSTMIRENKGIEYIPKPIIKDFIKLHYN